MKFVKHLISKSVRSDFLWNTCDRLFLRVARYAEAERRGVEFDRKQAQFLKKLFPDLVVRHGPFAGLKYGRAESKCSALLPKLLGSYEAELHPVLERLLGNDYALIVDVGCAEGFYAAGLAKRCPQTLVYAFDIDPEARELCRDILQKNQLAANVSISSFCGANELKSLVNGRRALIVCDCEGFEEKLFDADQLGPLAASDLIIEVHDFAVSGVGDAMRNRFAASHHVETIYAVDDEAKHKLRDYPELGVLPAEDRTFVLAERRPAGMSWVVAISKTSKASGTEI